MKLLSNGSVGVNSFKPCRGSDTPPMYRTVLCLYIIIAQKSEKDTTSEALLKRIM